MKRQGMNTGQKRAQQPKISKDVLVKIPTIHDFAKVTVLFWTDTPDVLDGLYLSLRFDGPEEHKRRLLKSALRAISKELE